MKDVTTEELEIARDAIIAFGENNGRSQLEALLIFEELVRQLKDQLLTNPDVIKILN